MGPRPTIQWVRVTLDCSDAEELGAFYSEVFGWEITARDGAGWLQLSNPAGGVGLNVQADPAYDPPVWPEVTGAQAKMMHFEVLVDDVGAAVRVVEKAGGSEAPHQPSDRDSTRIRIVLDPAGHPFCVFAAGE